MATRKLPDIDFVRECLDYDPDTGVFIWRERPRSHFVSDRGWWQWNPKFVGKPAGSKHWGNGGKIYWTIRLARCPILAHRIAWLLGHGIDPWPDEIDHIDGDPLNNRLSNLRLATRSQQMANTKRFSRGTRTGVKGVVLTRWGYDARVTMNGKTLLLGYFPTLKEATAARRKAAIEMHGEFVRHE